MELFKFVLLLTLASCVPFVSSASISCEVQTNFWTSFGSLKECFLRNINISLPRETVNLVSTQFANLNDFKSFYVDHSPLCFYIPFGIEVLFPNLEVLSVSHSGLRNLTKDDLQRLTQLRGIYLEDNQIETLDSNLFESNLKLQEISLSGNKLKYIEVGVFDNLPKLTKLELRRNPCIDKSAVSPAELISIKKDLHRNCQPKGKISSPMGEISFESFEALMNRIVEVESKLTNLQSQFKDSMENICEICRSKL